MRCGKCGAKKRKVINLQGRSIPYKSYESLKITTDVWVMGCYYCDNYMIGPGDAKRIDEACETSIYHQSHWYKYQHKYMLGIWIILCIIGTIKLELI